MALALPITVHMSMSMSTDDMLLLTRFHVQVAACVINKPIHPVLLALRSAAATPS